LGFVKATNIDTTNIFICR